MAGATCRIICLQHYLAFFFFFFLLNSSIFTCHARRQQQQPSQGPSYLRLVMNATDLPSEDSYDYIIVGGGTAGCPLAATLSQKFRVLVLERGGIGYSDPNVMYEEGFLRTLMDSRTFDSPAQLFTSEDGVPNARGRVLGGSSAINAGFYSRADGDFFTTSGLPWDLKLVNESYEWVENQIVFEPEIKTWQTAVRDGLVESGVGPYNGFSLDHKIGTKIGGSTFDPDGRRHSAADLLSKGRAKNMRVGVYASVERILLGSSFDSNSKPSAIGVGFRDQMGRYHYAFTREHGEVILCAGAIGSPQLLLLSGIGPRNYLSSWGIPVSHESPLVGQFLYDNPRNSINIVPSVPLEHSLIQVVGITNSGAYIEAASNVVPFLSPSHSSFIRSPSLLYVTLGSLITKITGPASSGYLRLASTDVRINPIVRFNYFQKEVDVERCVNGSRKMGEVMRSRAMREFRFRNNRMRYVGAALPGNDRNYEEMASFCRGTVSTIWHYHGGCVVGKVVDPTLTLYGIHSLRVVDGSVFSVSPGTNPQATLMMLGRYMGRKMIRERIRASFSF